MYLLKKESKIILLNVLCDEPDQLGLSPTRRLFQTQNKTETYNRPNNVSVSERPSTFLVCVFFLSL